MCPLLAIDPAYLGITWPGLANPRGRCDRSMKRIYTQTNRNTYGGCAGAIGSFDLAVDPVDPAALLVEFPVVKVSARFV